MIDPSPRARTAPVLGVVFCGGRSARMGFDKAQARWGETTLLEHAVTTLQSVAPEVVLACGSEPRYPRLGLDCVLDRLPDGGPLAGLEAALEHALEKLGSGWIYALACDLPRADARVFEHLLRHAQGAKADACLLEIERGSQPLYAAYATDCLPAVRSALDAGERRMIAWHAGHGAGAVVSLDLQELPTEIERSCADNVNTPEDLRQKREVHE